MTRADRDTGRHVVTAKVATLLGVPPADVTVHWVRAAERTTAVLARVRVGGEDRMAKVFTEDTSEHRAPRVFPTKEFLAPRRPRVRTPTLVATEWEALQTVGRLLPARAVPAAVARDECALVTSWVSGTSLAQILSTSGRRIGRSGMAEAREAFRHAGKLLRTLHEARPLGNVRLSLREYEANLDLLRRQADRWSAENVSVATRLLEAAMDRWGAQTPPIPVVLTHGDYSLSNVLWDDERRAIRIIDLEHVAARPALHDLTVMVANLWAKLIDPTFARDHVLQLEEAFWAGYDPSAPETVQLARGFAAVWVFSRFAARVRARRRKHWVACAARVANRGFAESTYAPLAWSAQRFPRSRGGFVVVVGPDGVGKTAVAAGLITRFRGPTRYVHFRPPLRGGMPAAPPSIPKAKPPHRGRGPMIVGWGRLAWNFILFWAGYLRSVRPAVDAGALVVGDRWAYGYLVQPTALKYHGPTWLARAVVRAMPQPDLTIILKAPPDVVHARKQELSPAEIAEEQVAWLQIPAPRRLLLNADRPLDHVIAEAYSAVFRQARG